MIEVILVVGMFFATYSVRVVSLTFFTGTLFNPLFLRALSLVPVSVLTALCVPLIFCPAGQFANPVTLPEFWATIFTIISLKLGPAPAAIVGIISYVVLSFLL